MTTAKTIANVLHSTGKATSSCVTVEVKFEYELDGVCYESQIFSLGAEPMTATAGVLLAPDWTGINDHARLQARKLAAAGAVVMIVDLYGKGVRPTSEADAQKASARLISDRQELRRRMAGAYHHLSNSLRPGTPVRVLGYSFGGLAALELARSGASVAGVAAVWSFLHNAEAGSASRIRGPVLVVQGTKDFLAPLSAVEEFATEMDAAKRSYQIVLLGGAHHGYTIPDLPEDPSSPLASDPDASLKTDGLVLPFLLGTTRNL